MLKGLNNFREKRICDVRYDQAENAASPRHQRTGLRIWEIPELIHHFPNTLGQLRIDRGHVVDRSGNSRGRNFGPSSYFTKIHTLACVLSSTRCVIKCSVARSVYVYRPRSANTTSKIIKILAYLAEIKPTIESQCRSAQVLQIWFVRH